MKKLLTLIPIVTFLTAILIHKHQKNDTKYKAVSLIRRDSN
jgi:hypothetical protein